MAEGLLTLLHRANQLAKAQFATKPDHPQITTRQVQVLAVIEATPGTSQTGIVDATSIDRSTVADIVRRLQTERLINRRRSKEDARAYVLELTTAGKKILQKGAPALAEAEDCLLAVLTATERATLVDLLGKVVNHQVAIDR